MKTVLSKNSDSLKTKFLTKQFLKKSKVLEKCKKIIDLKILKKCFNNDTAIETMFKKNHWRNVLKNEVLSELLKKIFKKSSLPRAFSKFSILLFFSIFLKFSFLIHTSSVAWSPEKNILKLTRPDGSEYIFFEKFLSSVAHALVWQRL